MEEPDAEEFAKSGQADRGASPADDPTVGIWRHLLDLDKRLFEQRNIRFLTPEARVVIHLKLSGSLSMAKAISVAGTSYRGFYAVLERLKQAGIVATVKDQDDQRVRRLNLKPDVPISPETP